ncbi:MAG: DNA repair protein RadA [Clostridia bacterium]
MKTNYICAECGSVFSRWMGKCPDCNAWNTLEETEIQLAEKSKNVRNKKTFSTPLSTKSVHLNQIVYKSDIRFSTGMNELDRVLGGGLVKGSAVLISGEPGIGKSTILLQICQHIGEKCKIMYVSGEESPSQLKLRATRIGVESDNLLVLCETNINNIIPEIEGVSPDIVIIDSIQTMYDDDLPSSPGSVTQVKQAAMHLINQAKQNDIAIIFVGHVNKDGAIAGPKVLEHIVDAVLYFEGDKQHAYRIIRAAKNRFGSTNEIGVFEMGDIGLTEVENPSELLLSQRPQNVSGNCAVCVMEGTRPILAEIQALSAPTSFPAPRRTASGLDYNRINLLLAVLEKRMGMRFSITDVYVNVAGGLKLEEPSCDLAIILALISSFKDIPLSKNLIAFGEIGLSGECRNVSNAEMRIHEAKRLGFTEIALPYAAVNKLKSSYSDVKLLPIRSIFDVLKLLT